jgi:CheY-like chemotaxis protein/two-component sensor histidine kinase
MESIGQLTAGLAHDFNNLLQVVSGNLELIASTTDPERLKRYVAAARSASERGAKLTRQLLAFARKTRLAPRRVDLAQIVNEFSELIESSLSGRAELHLSLRRGLPHVTLDPDQLEMALLNIVNNARDAMPDGGVVTVSTTKLHMSGEAESRSLTPGDYLILEVRDEGQGMSQRVAERAAEPFFTTKAPGSGTGLGLAMASGFVRQSGGRLEIESKEGFGTAVRMIFPVAPVSEKADVPTAAKLAPEARQQPSGVEHILVVEDHEEVLVLARGILESAGYQVTTAMSGEQALEVFENLSAKEPVSLLFTDLVMPGGMNGLDLVDAVCERDPNVSILVTTGYNEELVVNGPRKRSTDVLSKPYRRSELLDRVRQALKRRGETGGRRQASDFGAAEA